MKQLPQRVETTGYKMIRNFVIILASVYMCHAIHADFCEPVTVSLCQDTDYTMTKFPNMLGHARQEEAGIALLQIWPTGSTTCTSLLKEFLCGLYALGRASSLVL